MIALAGLAQALAAGLWLATAIYALLASQTFAYEQFLRPALMPALTWFADLHRAIVVAGLVVFVSLHWLAGTTRRRNGAVALTAVGAVWAVAAAALVLLPPLAALEPGRVADASVYIALVPILLVSMVDLAAASPLSTDTPRERHAADFVACLSAALIATLLSAAMALTAGVPLDASSGQALVSSGLLHLVVFLAVFLCLTAVRAIGALTGSARIEWAAGFLLLTGAVFAFLWRSVFPSIVADAAQQVSLAAAFSFAISVTLAAHGLRASTATDEGLQRLIGALAPRQASRATGFVLWLGAVSVAAWFGVRISRTADWNFVLANLTVVTTWLLVLAATLRVVRIQSPGRPVVLFMTTILVLAGNVAWTRRASAHAPATSGSWTAHDPAARLLANAVRHDLASPEADLVDVLQQHTNVTASVGPLDITLAPLTAPQPYRPHIFLFVIDSLRRDYLGAYNPAVTFTPSLDRLARDGVAFTHAFTRYGATGLAVPSIWTGSMLLHKQYVRPFAPMNGLAKLLAAQEYAQWISMDHILDTILPPSDRRVPLDRDRTVKDFRLCDTLREIRGRLTARPSDADPVFAYSLPQDIHVSAVAREGGMPRDGRSYPGFHAPVASRIAAIDACFSAFLSDLQTQGLYDDSIIIVTSDHGDSLGEDGRVGHAYTLFPEIVRIPLIVRVPPRIATGLEAENHGPVFSTDITPTLYALLGLRPAQPRPFFGRPLFRARGTPPRGAEGAVPVVAASYGAVYGALLDEGETLYVLDTINLQEHAFALNGGGPATPVAATSERRRTGQRAIRATVQDIAGYFGYRPGP